VKQAQMFAAIREPYGIERDDTLQLRDFPTLAHVIQFVYDRRPDLERPAAVPTAAEPSPVVSAEAAPVEDPVKVKVLEIASEQTGYPVDMLDLDLDLEADLGIDTVKQAQMFAAIREPYGIERDDTLQLRDFHRISAAGADRRPAAGARALQSLRSGAPGG
jgi:acyl carrier protein